MTFLLALLGSTSGQDLAEGEWISHQISLEIEQCNSVFLLAQQRFKAVTLCHPIRVHLDRDFNSRDDQMNGINVL